jgi:hypothetical protein
VRGINHVVVTSDLIENGEPTLFSLSDLLLE